MIQTAISRSLVLACFLVASSALAEPIAQDSDMKKKENTTMSGSYSMYEDSESTIKIDIHYSIEQKGTTGEGYGKYNLQGLDENFKTVYFWTQSRSVKADANDGINVTEYKRTQVPTSQFQESLKKKAVYFCFRITLDDSSFGLPQTAEGLVDELGDLVKKVKALEKGKSTTIGEWKWIKIK